MRKSRHTEEQVASAPKQAEFGTPDAGVRRKTEASGATFFRCKQQRHGGLGPTVRAMGV